MKLFKYIIPAVLLLATIGCTKENEQEMGKAVLSKEKTVVFDAVDAESQQIEVYSDGAWVATAENDWIHIDPAYGTKNQLVTITVDDNLDANGEEDVPRKGKITIVASSKRTDQMAEIDIEQKGDLYKFDDHLTVAELLAADAGKRCKIMESTVLAIAETGMVVKDESGVLYAAGTTMKDTKVGDVVRIMGKKATVNNIPALDMEDMRLLSSGAEVTYPTPTDITATATAYSPAAPTYISISGGVSGFSTDGALTDATLYVHETVGGNDYDASHCTMVNVLNAPAYTQYGQYNNHHLEVNAYCVGKEGSLLSVILVSIDDKGAQPQLPVPAPEPGYVFFFDDFSWTEPIAKAAGATSTIDVGTSATAPNIWNTEAIKEAFIPIFSGKGYTDLNPGEALMYLQPGYMKFSRTGGHNTALQLVLPNLPVSNIDVDINFDYFMMVQGDGTVDAGPVGVLLIGDGKFDNGTKLSDGQTSAQTSGQFIWNSAKTITARGVNKKTKFVFLMQRSYKENKTNPDAWQNWAVSGAGRFFIDNIKISRSTGEGEADAAVEAEVSVNTDLLTFEGLGGEQEITVKSDYKFTVEAENDWLTFDVTEGAAGKDVTVKVTCAPNEASTLRKSNVIITSEATTVKIPVVQSAAGQDLDPFIAVGQNSVDVTALKSTLDVKVQATEEYTVTPLVDWITVEPAPATKGMVLQETVKLNIAENTDVTSGRTGQVKFEIASKGVMSILTVNQEKAEPLDTDVIFKDDFSWVAPAISGYDKVCADFVNGTYETLKARIDYGNSNSVAIAGNETNRALVTAAGYTDLMLTNSAMYGQGTTANPYLKFCKNNNQSGLSFKPFDKSYPVVTISVDWAVHMTGTAVDASHLQFVIEGDGTFENGTKSSDAFTYSLSAPADPVWDKATAVIKGANENTVIKISVKEGFDGNFKASGQHRYYIDNIVIKKPIWSDDFSWVAPAISGYSKVCADFVNGTYETLAARIDYGNSNSVAIAGDATNRELVTAAGYTDLKLSNSAMYGQGTAANPYLKFCKSGKQSGLSFKPFKKDTEKATISVDWAVHMTNTAIDASHLQFVIEGDGTFENGSKTCEAFTYSLTAPADPVWNHASAVIKNASATTVIKISVKEAFDGSFAASGQHRYYIDNLVIL